MIWFAKKNADFYPKANGGYAQHALSSSPTPPLPIPAVVDLD